MPGSPEESRTLSVEGMMSNEKENYVENNIDEQNHEMDEMTALQMKMHQV